MNIEKGFFLRIDIFLQVSRKEIEFDEHLFNSYNSASGSFPSHPIKSKPKLCLVMWHKSKVAENISTKSQRINFT